MTVNETKTWLKELFEGVTDRANVPYFNHLETVANTVSSKNTEVVLIALLHDVLEDTDTTFVDLLAMGYSERVVYGVLALTKKDGESYPEYLDRVKANPDAVKVKLADLNHNSDLSRLAKVTNADLKRNVKYASAKKYLKGV